MFICKRRGPKLIVVPANARFSSFVYLCIIIPAGARCCPGHLDNDSFSDQAAELLTAE